jgi:hypothetical protein
MLRLTPREGPAAAPRFRTIQVCPKDWPPALRQAELCGKNRLRSTDSAREAEKRARDYFDALKSGG